MMVSLLALSSVAANGQDSCAGKYGLGHWICMVKERFGPDFDMVSQSVDNCPTKFNPSQRDADIDGKGNACDRNKDDKDWDGVLDKVDNCLNKYNPSQRDTDGDGKGDACDLNRKDVDWDGVKNGQDNCVWAYNPSQANNDGDKCGNPCDKCCKNIWSLKMYQLTGTCPYI